MTPEQKLDTLKRSQKNSRRMLKWPAHNNRFVTIADVVYHDNLVFPNNALVNAQVTYFN